MLLVLTDLPVDLRFKPLIAHPIGRREPARLFLFPIATDDVLVP